MVLRWRAYCQRSGMWLISTGLGSLLPKPYFADSKDHGDSAVMEEQDGGPANLWGSSYDRKTIDWSTLVSMINQVMDQTSGDSYLSSSVNYCCLSLPPYVTHLPFSFFLSLPFYRFLSLSLVIRCLPIRAFTHKMEGRAEVSIQNKFVALPAPYPLSSCRGDPGEPYHSSICKCPCTWATAWACWDWELIYANLRETVTAHHRAGHRHWWPYLPASTTTSLKEKKKCGKHEKCGLSGKRGGEEWQSQGDWGNVEFMVNKMYGCCRW